MALKYLCNFTYDKMMKAEGKAEAWRACNKICKHELSNAVCDARVLFDAAPEPSDPERATWPKATADYVDMLETLIDMEIPTEHDIQNTKNK